MAKKSVSIRLDDEIIEQLKNCPNKSEVIRNALGNDLSVKDNSKLNNCIICKKRFNDNDLNVVWTNFAYVFFCDDCKKKSLSKSSKEWLNIGTDFPNNWDDCSEKQKQKTLMQEIRSSFDKPLRKFARDSKGNLDFKRKSADYNIKAEFEDSINELAKKRLNNSNLVSKYKKMAKSYPAFFREGMDGELIVIGEINSEKLNSIHSEFID